MKRSFSEINSPKFEFSESPKFVNFFKIELKNSSKSDGFFEIKESKKKNLNF